MPPHGQQPSTVDSLAAVSQLRRRGHASDLIPSALTQAILRDRGAAKYGRLAARMWFTSDGLEQATRPTVAARRATRVVHANAQRVVDLGCGIGGDLIALAQAGLSVTGVEIDATTAAVATANVDALGLTDQVQVICADARTMNVEKFDAAFCDPARRRNGQRVFNLASYQPPWSFVLDLANRIDMVAVKVAPGIDHASIPNGAEAEWVSVDGDVVEAALWLGKLSGAVPTHGQRLHRATSLPTATSLIGSGQQLAPVAPLQQWLYEPDGAVIRAHLVAELAHALDATALTPQIAYLSADSYHQTPLAQAFEVVEVLPFSVKRLRGWLRKNDVGTVEIKKRGFAMSPEQLRAALKPSGSRAISLILTRIDEKPVAIIAQRAAAAASAR